MSKTVKKYILQFKVQEIETSTETLPNDFKAFYEKPLDKVKVITSYKIPENDIYADLAKAKKAIENIKLDKDFHDYYEKVNRDPSITSGNILNSFYAAFPEKVIHLSYYPIESSFFINALARLNDKQSLFNTKHLDYKQVEGFSESFLDALGDLKIDLKTFNFLQFNFSILPDERFSKLLKLTRISLEPTQEKFIAEEIKKLIHFDRKDKLIELLNFSFITKEFIETYMKDETLSSKFKKIIMKHVKKEKK